MGRGGVEWETQVGGRVEGSAALTADGSQVKPTEQALLRASETKGGVKGCMEKGCFFGKSSACASVVVLPGSVTNKVHLGVCAGGCGMLRWGSVLFGSEQRCNFVEVYDFGRGAFPPSVQ